MMDPCVSRLPLHIVEDHDEALPVIYRAIGSKSLPLHSITLVHFDAHPDLLSPNIQADQLTDRQQLFSKTDIADWILPAVYMGHVTCVVWLKPPWADQISDGEYPLIVGRDTVTGLIRLATPLSYFISELLYVPKGQLENVREIPLHVVTVSIESCDRCNMSSLEDRKDDTSPPPAKNPRLLFEGGVAERVSGCKAWVLDLDLDFFSTGNPYRGPFSQEQYELLRDLYQTPVVRDLSCEQSVLESVDKRRRQLSMLNSLWSCDQPTPQTAHALDLTGEQVCLVEEIRRFLGRMVGDVLVDQEFVHTCGLLTELPLHVSCEEEVGGLMESVSRLLVEVVESEGPPTLVTIARSSVDEYTPPAQVDHIQQLLVGTLTSVWGEVDTHTDYLEQHKNSPYEHPGRICDCSYL